MTIEEEDKRDREVIQLLSEQIGHLRQINKSIMQVTTLSEVHIKIVNENISQILALLVTQEDYV